MLHPRARAVEFIEWPRINDTRHQVADHLTRTAFETVDRPGCDTQQIGGGGAHQDVELVDVDGGKYLLLDLGNQLGTTCYGVDDTIAASADLLPKRIDIAAASTGEGWCRDG